MKWLIHKILASMASSSLSASFPLLFILAISYPVLAWGSKPISFNDNKSIFCFKFRVHIINGFSSNKNPLSLHCWSQDNDLGNHTLYIGGDFNFKFGLASFGKTIFHCDFKWAEKHRFANVFTDGMESSTCCDTNSCYWKTEDDGIYFSNDNKNYIKRLDWLK